MLTDEYGVMLEAVNASSYTAFQFYLYLLVYLIFFALTLLSTVIAVLNIQSDATDYRISLTLGNGRALIGRYNFQFALWLFLTIILFFIRASTGLYGALTTAPPTEYWNSMILLSMTILISFFLFMACRSQRVKRLQVGLYEEQKKSVKDEIAPVKAQLQEVKEDTGEIKEILEEDKREEWKEDR